MLNIKNNSSGFFDLQVNGYAGIDFNQNDVNRDDLHKACVRLKKDGVKGILATLITANIEDMKIRLRQIAQARESDPLVKDIIYGFHIEGPFLSPKPGYCGSHPTDLMMSANTDVMNELLEAANGLTRIVTLAPELDNKNSLIKMLTDKGIVVSAGHCNPTFDELRGAIDSGLTMYTHFGNGCPNSLPRHDNILQRVLSVRDKLWITFIADGIHIPFFALKNYLTLVGMEHSIIITDAISGAGAKPGIYKIGNMEIEIGIDRIVREIGKPSLAGSAVAMITSKQNLIEHVRLNEQQVEQLTCTNPKRAIGLIGSK